jgi:predicted lipoprotein
MPTRPTYPVQLAMDALAPDTVTLERAAAIALAVTDGYVVPAYRRLVDATHLQADAWAVFAANPAEGNVEALRATYHAACDAWAVAQLVRTGPITLFLRFERFAYWPEARNATQRALDALLTSVNPDELLPESLTSNQVAGQGLTALERLLYGDGEDQTAMLREEKRARVGAALARNLNVIANEILTEWIAEDGMRAALASGAGWNNLFADGIEAARLLLTDLVGAFRLMHDFKFLPVVGESIDLARPRMAEAWRSGRSKRNLLLNLEAANVFSGRFEAFLSPERAAPVEASFTSTTASLAALPDDIGEASADPARRPAVETARDAIKATQLLLTEILPADLGITLGFNALDGD